MYFFNRQPGPTKEKVNDNPAAQARLKMQDDSGGGLRGMRPAIRVQGREPEVRILVHKTPIFGTQGDMAGQGIISARAIQECACALSAGARNKSAIVARGIKDQTAAAS